MVMQVYMRAHVNACVYKHVPVCLHVFCICVCMCMCTSICMCVHCVCVCVPACCPPPLPWPPHQRARAEGIPKINGHHLATARVQQQVGGVAVGHPGHPAVDAGG